MERKTENLRSRLAMFTCAALIVVFTVLAGSCQTPGEVVSTDASVICPKCKTETKTMPIKGLTYTKHTCPSCGGDWEMDHTDFSVFVHACEHCETIVATCPLCAKE